MAGLAMAQCSRLTLQLGATSQSPPGMVLGSPQWGAGEPTTCSRSC